MDDPQQTLELVTLGVDTHAEQHVAAALDERGAHLGYGLGLRLRHVVTRGNAAPEERIPASDKTSAACEGLRVLPITLGPDLVGHHIGVVGRAGHRLGEHQCGPLGIVEGR